MSNIPARFMPAGLYSRQAALSDAQFPTYVKQSSFSARESLDAGLTIQTKEGDLVTLSSSAFTQFDAQMYNSKGLVQAEAGNSLVTLNNREVTLTTGENFSFSVIGDLNEDELDDIEAIIKGIDGIISEMAQGDMKDAIGIALSMGGYDTVSSFEADITYQRSYSMMSEHSSGPQLADTNRASEEGNTSEGEAVPAASDEAEPELAAPTEEEGPAVQVAPEEVKPEVVAVDDDDDDEKVKAASEEKETAEAQSAPKEDAAAEVVKALEDDDESEEVAAELVPSRPETAAEQAVADEDAPAPTAPEPFPENSIPWSKNKSSIKNIDHFLEKMIGELQNHEQKEVGLARQPLNKLFNHHMQNMKKQDKSEELYNAFETAQKRIDTVIEEMVVSLFESQLSMYIKE